MPKVEHIYFDSDVIEDTDSAILEQCLKLVEIMRASKHCTVFIRDPLRIERGYNDFEGKGKRARVMMRWSILEKLPDPDGIELLGFEKCQK